MYLKSLEIQGFKSFANRILFQFHNGITGVVGPNGSGKSNVSDAIRWVLGEQSAKSLRGGSMQDVIFAGTQSRKAMSFAFVAITLDNADHALPVDYEEVTVARRLYRSGESEYLINGTACRMRDIQELFYDTGIGKEGYSLIGQGQVEKILNGKPEERRELFDEAAGIVKYKHRKATALKKLDEEQANLVRVSDILSELNRQIGPLKRQSETARVYLAKREELKTYDVNQFLLDYERYQDSFNELNAKLSTAREDLENTNRALAQAKEGYETAAQELGEISGRIMSINSALTDQKLNRQQLAGRIDLIHEQIQTLDENDDSLRVRRERLTAETKQRQEQLSASQKRLDELLERAEKNTDDEDAARLEAKDLQDKIASLQAKIDTDKAAIIRLLNERTDIQAGRQRASTMIEQIALRESELNSRELILRSDEKAQSASHADLTGQESDAKTKAEDLHLQNERLNEELKDAQMRYTQDSQNLEKMREDYQRQTSRLETMKNIAERYEGYGGSIRRVMEQKDRNPGILGVVADLISTSKKYETAIETALGGSIQNIVTEDETTAKRMIAFLKENRFGRATFLPLTAQKYSRPFNDQGVLGQTGVIGTAFELVSCDEKYRDLADHLLGRTVVAEDIDTAIRIARQYHYSLRIVTLDGELLSPGGSMTGGAFKSGSNLLGRRREIEDMTKRLISATKALKELSGRVDSEHSRRNSLREQIAAVTGLIQQNEYSRSTLSMQLKDLDKRILDTGTAQERIRLEREQIAADRKSLEQEKDETGAGLKESTRLEEETNARIACNQREADELTKRASEVDERLSKIHVETARFGQEKSFISQNLERLKDELESRRKEEDQIRENLEANERVRAGRREEIASLQEKIVRTKQQEEELNTELQSLGVRKAQKEAGQKSFFEKREQLSEQNSNLDKEIYRLEEQGKKLEENREKSIGYLWDEYELTPVACRQLRREDLGSYTAIRKQIADLRRDIKDLGNVNVNAIDEYKELSERHEFLTAQHEDLVKSSDDLKKIIEELDEGMRTRFKEQFSRIQTEFDQTFRELFGGGKGTLELVEEEDILDAGIRVIAQPPGKKLQNMMQLSGGEKSLTAIALLFAIQNLKPSPFCLLDEIESALDENNVDRYARYLHKLTKHTQFIIITHRRGSMAAADRLYGITMQEKGVSALVSVDLVEDQLDN